MNKIKLLYYKIRMQIALKYKWFETAAYCRDTIMRLNGWKPTTKNNEWRF